MEDFEGSNIALIRIVQFKISPLIISLLDGGVGGVRSDIQTLINKSLIYSSHRHMANSEFTNKTLYHQYTHLANEF